MKNFFSNGYIALITALLIIASITIFGAIKTGAWHLLIIICISAALITTLCRDRKRESSKH